MLMLGWVVQLAKAAGAAAKTRDAARREAIPRDVASLVVDIIILPLFLI
jgi:hypothetical protein